MRFARVRRAPRRVVLYGKPGCHLCEDARLLLDQLSRRYRLTVEEIDIRGDPALYRRYDILIPVIRIEHGPEISAPITRATLLAALDHETARE